MKIQGLTKPPRLDPEPEHVPGLTLAPKLLIYYIEESRPNPPDVDMNERLSFHGTPLQSKGCLALEGLRLFI